MFCPKCARENLERNKFCNGCGASLRIESSPVQSFAPPASIVPPPAPPLKIETQTVSPTPQLDDSFAKPEFNQETSTGKSIEAGRISLPIAVADEKWNEENNAGAAKVAENSEAHFDNLLLALDERIVDDISAVGISEPEAALKTENRLKEPLNDYFSEVAGKYGTSRRQSPTDKNNRLVATIPIVAGAIVLLGLLGAALYFTNKNQTVPTNIVAANEKTPDENVSSKRTPPQAPPEMVRVAGGEFMMGANSGDEFSRPAHLVSVKPFFIDKTEVTCEEYKKFVDATGHQPPVGWQNGNFPPGAARRPVTGVNWDDANAFAKWRDKRLPSEAEWEFAARGTDGRIYPWGNDWKPEMANADKQKTSVQDVAASDGQSPFGVFDLSGNAWEWTADDALPYPNGKPFESNAADAKIIRGGFFGSSKEKATAIFRRSWGARSETDYTNTGFRCVRDIPSN